jgi:hypothetical protein
LLAVKVVVGQILVPDGGILIALLAEELVIVVQTNVMGARQGGRRGGHGTAMQKVLIRRDAKSSINQSKKPRQ